MFKWNCSKISWYLSLDGSLLNKVQSCYKKAENNIAATLTLWANSSFFQWNFSTALVTSFLTFKIRLSNLHMSICEKKMMDLIHNIKERDQIFVFWKGGDLDQPGQQQPERYHALRHLTNDKLVFNLNIRCKRAAAYDEVWIETVCQPWVNQTSLLPEDGLRIFSSSRNVE